MKPAILILYFSGTGNTFFVAEKIYQKLKELKYDVKLETLEIFPPERVSDFDILIFGFPVYAAAMPGFVKEYVKKCSLPKTRGVFLFSTLGFYGANAMTRASGYFKKLNFTVIGNGSIVLPGSDGLAMMSKNSHFIKRIKKRDYNNLEKIKNLTTSISAVIEKTEQNSESPKLIEMSTKISLPGLLAEGFLKLLYPIVEKRFKKKFYADNRCTLCGLCEKICPSGNIKIADGHVTFDNRCYLCMRCIHQCPEEAIQIGRLTVNKFRWKGPANNYKPLAILRNPHAEE